MKVCSNFNPVLILALQFQLFCCFRPCSPPSQPPNHSEIKRKQEIHKRKYIISERPEQRATEVSRQRGAVGVSEVSKDAGRRRGGEEADCFSPSCLQPITSFFLIPRLTFKDNVLSSDATKS